MLLTSSSISKNGKGMTVPKLRCLLQVLAGHLLCTWLKRCKAPKAKASQSQGISVISDKFKTRLPRCFSSCWHSHHLTLLAPPQSGADVHMTSHECSSISACLSQEDGSSIASRQLELVVISRRWGMPGAMTGRALQCLGYKPTETLDALPFDGFAEFYGYFFASRVADSV